MTTINLLMLFREIIPADSQNYKKVVSAMSGQNAELLIIKAEGTYSYQWILKGQYIFRYKEYGWQLLRTV
jgi:hypothetical protein